MIPHADQIRQLQAPSTEKLWNRCVLEWQKLAMAKKTVITRETKFIQVPIEGETEEQVKEVIEILEGKELGYTYSYEFLPTKEVDGWTTGYLRFTW